MKSPFPGMDPYLDDRWRDFHARMVMYACDQIEDTLPRTLVARVEQRIVFEVEDQEYHRYPDVRLVERLPVAGTGAASTVAEAPGIESFLVQVDSEPMTETFIQILDVETGNRVITAIEFLSITNKMPGEGLDQYRKKQEEYRDGKVSLVEIDLLRSGRRGLVMPLKKFPKKSRTIYQACVRRGWQPGYVEVFPIHLRRPLPQIKVPLREKEQELRLDLQPLFEVAYRKGRYADTIDYKQPCEPPLDEDDAKWADELLKAAGKR